MADAFVTVLLEQLTSIIRQQVEQEVKLVVGVDEEVEQLTSNLRAIHAVLDDAEKRQVKEATVRDWLFKLKDAAYDIDDVLDEWSTAILKSEIEKKEKEVENALALKKKVCSFIPSPCHCFGRVALRHDIAHKIKQLNERLDVIANEKNRYNFNLSGGPPELERQITSSVIDVSEVKGRDKDEKTIVNMLLIESSQNERVLHIISIVGMGGLGKTTLARLVYNNDKVNTHFDKRIWVCVSDPFDEIRIAKAILETLTGSATNLVELETLLQHIRESIAGKNVLLVLDDVWTEEEKKWEQLKHSLKYCSPGSRILVTTRKENVAKSMGSNKMYHLRELSKEESWSLFSQIAFLEMTSEQRQDLEEIGKKITYKCNGLPLVAKTLGSFLRFKRTKEAWQSVLDSKLWEIEEAEKGIFPPLMLSYYDLPSKLKRCFSYCAVFPKDYNIRKDELIKLWMAQGYLRGRGSIEMEIVGEEYFDILAMHSFFQDFEKDEEDGSIIRCKMHDIVHEFAQFLTKKECFMVKAEPSKKFRIESCERIPYLTMILSGSSTIPDSIYNAKKVRGLFVEGNNNLMISDALPNLFNQLMHLRSLKLQRCPIEEVPHWVGKLNHLRYLNLSGNRELKELPETVCDLCNLQTLNIYGCYNLTKLPRGMEKLINLRHLQNLGTYSLRFMPEGIERLTDLRTLSSWIVGGGGNNRSRVGALTLAGLRNLNQLQGNLWIRDLGNVVDVSEAKQANLKNKNHLFRLSLYFKGEEAEGRRNDDEILEALEPPPYLKYLEIFSSRGSILFANWMTSLTKLKHVIICNCESCECLPPLGKLRFLESLKIWGMSKVKRVGNEFVGIEREEREGIPNTTNEQTSTSSLSIIAFPKLTKLNFRSCREWEEWDYGTTITIMPCLRLLRISYCPKLKSLPEHLLQKTSLEHLEITGCPILEERYGKERGEDWSKISRIPSIKIDYEYVQRDDHRRHSDSE